MSASTSRAERRDRLFELAGLVFAVILAVAVNVLASRHYRRWDWTADARYTLSTATTSTLASLDGPVDVWLLAAAGDPAATGVRQLLVAYEAASAQVHVHVVDPDRDVLALDELRRRFHVETGRSEDGRAIADAMVVVAKGDRHWFLTPDDLVDVVAEGTNPDEANAGDATGGPRAEPREEQALTIAFRQVVAAKKPRLCFTRGHGEPRLDDEAPGGLATLKDLLEKSNDEVTEVDTLTHDPFTACDVAIVAGPRQPFAPEETERLRTYLLQGGNALFALSPAPDPSAASATGLRDLRLGAALTPFGVALDEDLVVVTDPARTVPASRGLSFSADVAAHPITAGLVPEPHRDAPRVVLGFARSLSHVAGSSTTSTSAIDLLSTGPDAVTLTHLPEATDEPDAPIALPPGAAHANAVIAMAAERAKVSAGAPHGPRIVVVGSATVLDAANWSEPAPVHGAAFFVENALSWLAALPPVVDIPKKRAVSAGMSLTDASRDEIHRYVLLYMPAAVALLGLAIGLRRRSTEGLPRAKAVAKKPKKRA